MHARSRGRCERQPVIFRYSNFLFQNDEIEIAIALGMAAQLEDDYSSDELSSDEEVSKSQLQ